MAQEPNDNDNNGPGLGTAAGAAVISAAGTAGAALANGARVTGEKHIEKLEKQLADANKALHESWGAEKVKALNLTPDEQKLFDAKVKPVAEGTKKSKVMGPKVPTYTAEAPLKHSAVSEILEKTKENATDETKGLIDSLTAKLKPIEQLESSTVKAGKNRDITKALSETWKKEGSGWVERLEGSLAHSPKTFALAAAPLIAAGAYMGINALTSSQKAAVNGASAGRE